MPLSAPAPREHIHTRQIECRGYRREDGLWDIEAHLTDVKTYSFESDWRGTMTPGTPVHDMWMRLTVDDDFIIRAVEAVTDASPYQLCPEVTVNYQRLVGLSIRPGFIQKVRELLGGTEGCTHLVELLNPLATTCFQTIFPYRHRHQRENTRDPSKPARRPRLLDTCYAYATDGKLVKRYWPEFYTGS
ncbi:MAG TPA: DUF2889 domain-containing protein [Stellaceae bacterium]|nr:DUF2889 domain-containing protein [Stellaceae bacterium]